MDNPQQKRRRGCLLFGGITLLVMVTVVLLGAYFGLRYARKLANQLTDTQPMVLPTTQLPQAQMFQLRDRVDTFRDAVRDGDATPPLELSSDELNSLIATDPALAELKNHLYVTIKTNELQAQISFLAEDVGLQALRGRYVNGSGVFTVGLTNSELNISAVSLTTKGKPVPRHVMREITAENLASKFNADPRASAGLKKIQAIEVKDGKLIIVPRKTNP